MTKVAVLYDSYSTASSFDPPTQNIVRELHAISTTLEGEGREASVTSLSRHRALGGGGHLRVMYVMTDTAWQHKQQMYNEIHGGVCSQDNHDKIVAKIAMANERTDLGADPGGRGICPLSPPFEVLFTK